MKETSDKTNRGRKEKERGMTERKSNVFDSNKRSLVCSSSRLIAQQTIKIVLNCVALFLILLLFAELQSAAAVQLPQTSTTCTYTK